MESGRSFFTLPSWFVIVAILVVGLSGGSCSANDDGTNCTSSCGNIHNISYPFRLKHDPKHCGNSYFTLSCEKNITLLNLPSSGEYYVQAINYHNQTIRLLDPGLEKDNCSSSPRYPLALMNRYRIIYPNDGRYYISSTPVTFLKCANPVNSSIYVDTAPCISTTSLSSQPKTYGYFMIGWTNASDFVIGCSVEWTTAMLDSYNNLHQNASYEYIHNALLYGFDLGYSPGYYPLCKSGWDRFSTCLPYTFSGFFRYMARRFYGT
ncbi:hypothetical protein L3X38_012102 [Prunus dulcis]|uniref:Wall-associated receptor kinase galacturonan-binding domain-containing protein n=1 Tax=Prunus dulcis TaxID=3755 RepID=A0AAD4WIP0_PRUDU|nr:hypothetical protein L3X38_012102 [Prunus dulcis]